MCTTGDGIGSGGSLSRLLLSAGLLLALIACSGCSLPEIRRQSSLIGNAGEIVGTINRATDQKGPIVVARFKEDNGVYILDNLTQADTYDTYKFMVTPGTYYIAAFIDRNGDGTHQQGEPWNYYGHPSAVIVEARTITLETLTITDEPPEVPAQINVEKHLVKTFTNLGRIIRLDDPIFTTDNYSIGMWRALDFLDQIGGGLMFLQEYEQGKIPVIFVHGVNGGPSDLKGLIESLDRSRFQPWILYYPSGLRLDIVSEYLVTAVRAMQNRHEFKRFAVVGHSMGGLVARAFVKYYVEHFPERIDSLALLMSINSPMGGMPSAAFGIKAPFMVQSWVDVSPESEFLKRITNWSLPSSIPYYLIFSYKDGNDGDGTVSMRSQTPLKMQQEAIRMYGFNNSHVGTLTDKAFLGLFTKTLDTAVK